MTKVAEGGEYTYGTIKEGRESYRLETFGTIFAITRQALVNDDLGAFNAIPARLGTAARAFEAAQLAAILMANPNMADGKPVFHADHGNVKRRAPAPRMTLPPPGWRCAKRPAFPAI